MTTIKSKRPTVGIRHLQVLLIFLNFVTVYVSRLNVAVAVVAMTNAETTNPNFPEYDWSEKHKSYIISSFYWGFALTQFPGGYLSRRFGAKITMLWATFCTALLSLSTPFCIPWGGWQIFCGIRVVQGLFQGLISPCIHEHLAKWLPPHERFRLGALSHTGIECGTVLAMGVSGLIANGSMGWPGISYVSAALCFGWCALWLAFAANNAPASRFISNEEREYIESSLKREDNFHKQQIPIPWRAICTSIPLYALLVVRCAEAWGFSTIQGQIPSYMHGVLQLEIKSNALFSALPYLTMGVVSYTTLIVGDILLKKEIVTLTVLRKTVNSIASWVPAVALIGVGFLEAGQKAWAIALLTFAVGINGGVTIGCVLNTIDLSPNHAGILMGIISTISNFVPVVTPLIVGIIVTDVHDRTLWQIVFIIAALTYFLGNLVYIIWGSAEAQPWDAVDYMTVQADEEKPGIAEVKRRVTFDNLTGMRKVINEAEKEEGQTDNEHKNTCNLKIDSTKI